MVVYRYCSVRYGYCVAQPQVSSRKRNRRAGASDDWIRRNMISKKYCYVKIYVVC